MCARARFLFKNTMNLKLHQDAIIQEFPEKFAPYSLKSPRARTQLRKTRNKYILIQVGPNSEQK